MKIKLYSDLHLEFGNFTPIDDGEDLVVLAGDIDTGTNAIQWILKHFENRLDKVIYLPGNHEFYDGDMTKVKKELHDLCLKHGIKSLIHPGAHHVLGDYVVVGGTLWTAFDFWYDEFTAKQAAMRDLNDYYCITLNGAPLHANDTIAEHQQTMRFLCELLSTFKGTKKVIVATHMAPSVMSAPEKYKTDIITSAYCSRLENWILERPEIKLWMHGHMHSSSDYMIGDCRVVANPRGYSRRGNNENKSFDEHLLIEI